MTDWYKIKRWLIRVNWVEKQFYPATWKPWSNTVAYYPLTSTTTGNDQSGNNNNLTNSWVTFWTYHWVNCWYFNGSWYLEKSWSLWTWSSAFTVSSWFYWDWTIISGKGKVIFATGSPSWSYIFAMWMIPAWNIMVWWWSNDRDTNVTLSANTWYHCVMAQSWWTITVYLNWTSIYTWSVSFNISSHKTCIWRQANWTDYFYWNISEVIIENKSWSSAEVSDYYNWTKWRYWL